jgi:hypothetical protein
LHRGCLRPALLHLPLEQPCWAWEEGVVVMLLRLWLHRCISLMLLPLRSDRRPWLSMQG